MIVFIYSKDSNDSNQPLYPTPSSKLVGLQNSCYFSGGPFLRQLQAAKCSLLSRGRLGPYYDQLPLSA